MRILLKSRLFKPFRRFARDDRGAVILIFAMVLLPLFSAVALSIDFAQAYLVKTRLGYAIDAAALAVASSQGTNAQMTTRMNRFLEANFTANNLGDVQTPALSVTNDKVTISASATMPTSFGRVPGFDQLVVNASNEIKRSGRRMEVALVIDNTGSMGSNSKLTNTKTAARNFIDTLVTATANATMTDPLKIGLVPFNTSVNVGSTYSTAAWMDSNGVSPIASQIFNGTPNVNRFNLFAAIHTSWNGCVETRPQPYDALDTAPTATTPATLYVPYFAPDEPDTSTNFSNDYLADLSVGNWQQRQGNVLKYIGYPSVSNSFGPNRDCTVQALTRMTTNYSGLKTTINNMTANGNTYVPAGIMWGWHLLSPNGPFSDGRAYNDKTVQKFMVVMTDGENVMNSTSNSNQSYYSGLGYIWQGRLGITAGGTSQRQAAMDARMAAVCTNAKNAGITIYVVAVEVSSANLPQLRSCATDVGKFYDITSGGLNTTFQSIAKSIQSIHISK